LIDFKKIDWNMLKRYTSPQAVKDFDRFLDSLPLNVGYNALIAAGLAWVLAGGAVFFTSIETAKVSKVRTALAQVRALQPPIPVLKYTPVSQATLKALEEKLEKTYKGISLKTGVDGEVTVSAADTDFFPQFLGAISALQRGGKNWKVRIDTLCVGRECAVSKLLAVLKVESVRVGEPDLKKEDDDGDSKDKGADKGK
jgi:hypothetical protein